MQPANKHSIIPVNLFRRGNNGRMFPMLDLNPGDLDNDELVFAAEPDGETEEEFFIVA
jgi:hypothetical protein